jgi:hypothetical protein
MRKSFIIGCVSIALLFSSCATRLSVQVMKPAEINMAGARKIAILDFDYPRQNKADNFFSLLILSMTGQLNERTDTPESRVAVSATNKMTQALISTNYFTIVNYRDIVNKMSSSPIADVSAIAIGKNSGVEAIIIGEITEMSRSYNDWSEVEKIKDSKTGVIQQKTVYYVTARTTFGMTYLIISAKTGEVMAKKSFSDFVDQKAKQSERKNLASIEAQCEPMLNNWIPQITTQIAPYMVREYRTLVEDKAKNPNMKEAKKLFTSRAYDKALAIYLDVWEKTQNSAAGIDAAIMYDTLGRIDDAVTQIDAVVNATSDKAAIKERARIMRLKADNDKLSEQLN